MPQVANESTTLGVTAAKATKVSVITVSTAKHDESLSCVGASSVLTRREYINPLRLQRSTMAWDCQWELP